LKGRAALASWRLSASNRKARGAEADPPSCTTNHVSEDPPTGGDHSTDETPGTEAIRAGGFIGAKADFS